MPDSNSHEPAASRTSADAHRDLVRDGYDAIAQTYLTWASRNNASADGSSNARVPHLERLLNTLPAPAQAAVLELGCGAGVPGTQLLAAAVGRVVANDISPAQVELARTLVTQTNVEFVAEDMTKLQYEPGSFEAVVGFYSIIHLPREDQRTMLRRIAMWLKPGGYLLCNLGTKPNEGDTADWLGTKMYWSSLGAETNRQVVRDAGFEAVYDEIQDEVEDGVEVSFQWILAKKTS